MFFREAKIVWFSIVLIRGHIILQTKKIHKNEKPTKINDFTVTTVYLILVSVTELLSGVIRNLTKSAI